MSSNRLPRILDGWVEFWGDQNWQDYGSKWGKKAADGSWFIIRFENKEEWGDGAKGFSCDILWVDLPNVKTEARESALKSCGWEMKDSEHILCPFDGTFVAEGVEQTEQVLVECLVGYGTYGVLDSSDSKNYPVRLLCEMVRRCKELLKEATQKKWELTNLSKSKRKTMNRIGTTVEQAARGDILGGLRNYLEDSCEPRDPNKDLMLAIMGKQL